MEIILPRPTYYIQYKGDHHIHHCMHYNVTYCQQCVLRNSRK